MKKWELRENFMNLIVAVSKHDQHAALWILENRSKLQINYAGSSLADCFNWEFTPQGYNYWDEIHSQVGAI